MQAALASPSATRWRTSLGVIEAYSGVSSVPLQHGTLPPKVKEVIYVAIDASTTHRCNPGARIHIGNALRQGATHDEVMEVRLIVSVLGIHAISNELPVPSNCAGAVAAAK